jgi:hypothetical protein
MRRRIWFASRPWSHTAVFDDLHLVRQPKNRNTRGPFYVIVATLSHMYMTAPRRSLLQNVQGCGDIEWSSPRSMHASLSSSSAMALYPKPSHQVIDYQFQIIYIADPCSNPLSELQREGIGVLRAREYLV